ncbi:MAG: carbohydrate ABC transporter permease [Lachnospiraceae bacterium]
MKKNTQKKIIGTIFVLPMLLLFLLFTVYPLVSTFILGFYGWDGYNTTKVFVGFSNFIQVFHDRTFWLGVRNIAILALSAFAFMNTIALLLAILVSTKIPGAKFYRVVYYLPVLLSGIVVGFIWRWLFNGDAGLINAALRTIGLSSLTRDWLSSGETAMFAIIVASIWQGIGASFILYMAALTNVPNDLYESASLDGAAFFQKLFYITLPSIRNMMTIVIILTMTGSVGTYQVVLSLTNEGPAGATTVPMVYILNMIQKYYNYGYGTAMAVILGLMLLVLSLIRLLFDRRKEN